MAENLRVAAAAAGACREEAQRRRKRHVRVEWGLFIRNSSAFFTLSRLEPTPLHSSCNEAASFKIGGY